MAADETTRPADSPSSDLRFEDGLGQRLAAQDPFGEPIEQLRLCADLASLEPAIRERIGRLINFRHARYVRLRGSERLPGPDKHVVIAYDAVQGARLAQLLDLASGGGLRMDIDVALAIVRELLPAIAVLHDSRNVTHGAIGPERLVLTPQGRLIIVDHGLGLALGKTGYSRRKFWQQLRVAVPPGSGKVAFDARTDVVQIGMVALALVLARPIGRDEYPQDLGKLIDSARESSAKGQVRPLAPELRAWLERALPTEHKAPFMTVREAQQAFEALFSGKRTSAGATALKSLVTRYEALGRGETPADAPAAARPAAGPVPADVRVAEAALAELRARPKAAPLATEPSASPLPTTAPPSVAPPSAAPPTTALPMNALPRNARAPAAPPTSASPSAAPSPAAQPVAASPSVVSPSPAASPAATSPGGSSSAAAPSAASSSAVSPSVASPRDAEPSAAPSARVPSGANVDAARKGVETGQTAGSGEKNKPGDSAANANASAGAGAGSGVDAVKPSRGPASPRPPQRDAFAALRDLGAQLAEQADADDAVDADEATALAEPIFEPDVPLSAAPDPDTIFVATPAPTLTLAQAPGASAEPIHVAASEAALTGNARPASAVGDLGRDLSGGTPGAVAGADVVAAASVTAPDAELSQFEQTAADTYQDAASSLHASRVRMPDPPVRPSASRKVPTIDARAILQLTAVDDETALETSAPLSLTPASSPTPPSPATPAPQIEARGDQAHRPAIAARTPDAATAAPSAPDAKKPREASAPAAPATPAALTPAKPREPLSTSTSTSTPVTTVSTKPVIEIKPASATKTPVAAKAPVEVKPPVQAKLPAAAQSPSEAKSPVDAKPSVEAQPPLAGKAPDAAKLPVEAKLPVDARSPIEAKLPAAAKPPVEPKPPAAATPTDAPVAPVAPAAAKPVAAKPAVAEKAGVDSKPVVVAGTPVTVKPVVASEPGIDGKPGVEIRPVVAAKQETGPKVVVATKAPSEPTSSVGAEAPGAAKPGVVAVAAGGEAGAESESVVGAKAPVAAKPVAGSKPPAAAKSSVDSMSVVDSMSAIDTNSTVDSKSTVDSRSVAGSKSIADVAASVAAKAVVEPVSFVSSDVAGEAARPSSTSIDFIEAVPVPASAAPVTSSAVTPSVDGVTVALPAAPVVAPAPVIAAAREALSEKRPAGVPVATTVSVEPVRQASERIGPAVVDPPKQPAAPPVAAERRPERSGNENGNGSGASTAATTPSVAAPSAHVLSPAASTVPASMPMPVPASLSPEQTSRPLAPAAPPIAPDAAFLLASSSPAPTQVDETKIESSPAAALASASAPASAPASTPAQASAPSSFVAPPPVAQLPTAQPVAPSIVAAPSSAAAPIVAAPPRVAQLPAAQPVASSNVDAPSIVTAPIAAVPPSVAPLPTAKPVASSLADALSAAAAPVAASPVVASLIAPSSIGQPPHAAVAADVAGPAAALVEPSFVELPASDALEAIVSSAAASVSELGEPSRVAPSHAAPSHAAPSHAAPSHAAPSHGAPAYGAPSYAAPSYEAPSHEALRADALPFAASMPYSAPADTEPTAAAHSPAPTAPPPPPPLPTSAAPFAPPFAQSSASPSASLPASNVAATPAPVSAENLVSRRSIDWHTEDTVSEDVATPAWARGVVSSVGDDSASTPEPQPPLRDEPLSATAEDLVLSSIADVPIASASRRAAWLRFRKPLSPSWRSDGSDAAQGHDAGANNGGAASDSAAADASTDTGTHRRQVALLHPGSGFLGAALNEAVDAPPAPRPRPVRRLPRMRINWKRTLAASLVVSLLEGVAFATAYWFATPTEPGSLLVETTPVGIEVLVDGRVSGKTPYSGSLAPGRHTIELRVGASSRVIPVEISPGVQTMQRVLWSKGLRTGQARITSTPAGARVNIDGLDHGKTPLTVSTLAAGRHNVVIVSDSGTVSAPLSISPGETTEMDVPVFPGWVSVLAPVELQIYEGERLLGTTEGEKLLLAPGKHTLTFVSEPLGYRGSQTVLVTPGATAAVSMALPKAPVSVVGPVGAELFIDGEPAGALPIDSVRALLGTRDFVIRHPQFGERRQAITVTQKAPARVVFD